jgi:hypothetical protein
MSEMSLHEVGTTIRKYRFLEALCKEWNCTISELERTLPENTDVLHLDGLRSAAKRALNQSRLEEVAFETGMSHANYLSLEQAFAHETSTNTRFREDRPLAKSEIKQRVASRMQTSLFDEPETFVTPLRRSMDQDDDFIGEPLG